MDTVLKFPGPGRASCQSIHTDITTKRLVLRSLFLKTTCNFDSDKMGRRRQNAVAFKSKTPHYKSWNSGSILAMASKRDSKFSSNSFSPSQQVDRFYACINEKNLQKLDDSISSDAYFDDFTFPKPFQGKKVGILSQEFISISFTFLNSRKNGTLQEIMNFLKQLMASMGENVKFKVVHICEGDDYTATANWHLEWKSAQIPFTRGSTFFNCSKEGEKIVIKKAEVLIESPIKPGSIVLTLLKTVTSLFDDFPKATEWFLRSPHVVLNWIRKIYSIFIAPIVNPLIEGYIQFWSLGARLVGYIFSTVIFITKICDHNSSSASFSNHVSSSVRATNGPTIGGKGGGLLKATIGSMFSFLIISPSLLACFLGIEVAPIIPHDDDDDDDEANPLAWRICFNLFMPAKSVGPLLYITVIVITVVITRLKQRDTTSFKWNRR